MRLLVITQKVDIEDPILGFFHSWIIEMAKRCDSVIVICLQMGKYTLPSNVKVYSLGKENGSSRFVRILRFYTYIINERNKYDSVFVHMNQKYVILGGIIWRILFKKIGLWYTHKSVSLSLVIAERLSNSIFTASKESFRLPSKKCIVTGHGIDTALFIANKKLKKNSTSLMMVGRISKIKNIDILVDACAILPMTLNYTLSIVGPTVTPQDIEYKRVLRSTIDLLNLSGKVSFIGSVNNKDMPGLYSGADIMINLSSTGSFDKAVLEAMSCEVVVVTPNEAFKDILEPFGLYIEHLDIESVASSIENSTKSINDQKLKEKLRAYVVENHSLSSLVPKLLTELSSYKK